MAHTRLGGIEPQSPLRLPVFCVRLKAITLVYLPTATLMLLSSLISAIKNLNRLLAYLSSTTFQNLLEGLESYWFFLPSLSYIYIIT